MTRTYKLLTSILSCLVLAGHARATDPLCEPLPCAQRKNIILIVADDLGAEDLPYFSSPIRWAHYNPNHIDSLNNRKSYGKLHADWNNLSARMLAIDINNAMVDPGVCKTKGVGFASWPNPLADRGCSGCTNPTVQSYCVYPDNVNMETGTTPCASTSTTAVLYGSTACGVGGGSGTTLPATKLAVTGFGGLNAVRESGFAMPRFYTTAAVCGPSRYSMMTGRQWLRVHNGDYSVHMDNGEVTIAEYLRDHSCGGPGYTSAYFGKWHLGVHQGKDTTTDQGSPWVNGFVHGVLHEGNKMGHTVSSGEQGFACQPPGTFLGPGACPEDSNPSDDDPEYSACDSRCQENFNDAEPPIPFSGCCAYGDEPGIGRYKAQVDNTTDNCANEGSSCDNSTRLYTALAINFIKQNGMNPFFLTIAYPAVHNGAVGAPKTTRAHFDGSRVNGSYMGAIEEMDAAVGRIRATLADPMVNILDKTLIFFTSDNGGVGRSNGHPDFKGSKTNSYEAGIRVGLVGDLGSGDPTVTLPGGVAMSGVDFFPTFAAAAGLSVDADAENIDGHNFLPVLRGAVATCGFPRDFAYAKAKRSVIMARQIPIDSTSPSTDWPRNFTKRGVCALVDEKTYTDPGANDVFLPVYGTSCKPCAIDTDCTKEASEGALPASHPDSGYATCEITSGDRPYSEGGGSYTEPQNCNRCVPAQWKVRSVSPKLPPTNGMIAMSDAGEELFNLSGDPTETKNCAHDVDFAGTLQPIWFDLRCRLYKWKDCVTDHPDADSCEADGMDEWFTSSNCS